MNGARTIAVGLLLVVAAGCTEGDPESPVAEVTVTTPLGCNTETIAFMTSAPGRTIAQAGDMTRSPDQMREAGDFAFRLEEISLAEEVLITATCFTFVEEEQTIDRFWRMTVVSPFTDRIGGLMEVLWIDNQSFVTSPDQSVAFSHVLFLDDGAFRDGARVAVSWGLSEPIGRGLRLELPG